MNFRVTKLTLFLVVTQASAVAAAEVASPPLRAAIYEQAVASYRSAEWESAERQLAQIAEAAHEPASMNLLATMKLDGKLKVMDLAAAERLLVDARSAALRTEAPAITDGLSIHVEFLLGMASYKTPDRANSELMARNYLGRPSNAGVPAAQYLRAKLLYTAAATEAEIDEARSLNLAAIRSGNYKLKPYQRLADPRASLRPKEVSIGEFKKTPLRAMNAALIFAESRITGGMVAPSASLNGTELGKPGREGPVLLVVKPDRYEFKFSRALAQLGCGSERLLLDARIRSKYVLDVGVKQNNLLGCSGPDPSWKSYSAALPAPKKVYLVGFNSLEDVSFESEETEAIEDSLIDEAVRESTVKIAEASVAELDKIAQRLRSEEERIAREGDGTLDDLACKKRNLTPQTSAYVECRSGLEFRRNAEKKAEEERAAKISADAERRAAVEREKADAVAARKLKEEELRAHRTDSSSSLNIEEAKRKCRELGFGIGTEAYGKCVLQLSK